MIGLINAPIERAQAVAELAQKTKRTGNALVVVTRLGQIVNLVRIPPADRTIGVPDHQEKLGLDADIEEIASFSARARTRLRLTRGQNGWGSPST